MSTDVAFVVALGIFVAVLSACFCGPLTARLSRRRRLAAYQGKTSVAEAAIQPEIGPKYDSICPECHGLGVKFVTRNIENPVLGDLPGRTTIEWCPRCDGHTHPFKQRDLAANLEIFRPSRHIEWPRISDDPSNVDDSIIWPLLRIAQNTPKCELCREHMAPAGGTTGPGGFNMFACWECGARTRQPKDNGEG